MDAVTQWLARARGHDLVAVAAQEASYPHSRANLKPEAVWAETLAAQRGGGLAEAEAARDAARLAVAEGGSTASSSDSEEPHDAAGRTASSALETDPSDAPRRADMGIFSAKKKRGFFGSSYFARASGALAGALAGGVAAGPLAPFGLVAGAAAGYYSSAKLASGAQVAQTLVSRRRRGDGPGVRPRSDRDAAADAAHRLRKARHGDGQKLDPKHEGGVPSHRVAQRGWKQRRFDGEACVGRRRKRCVRGVPPRRARGREARRRARRERRRDPARVLGKLRRAGGG